VSSAIHSTCDAGVANAAECRSQPRHPKLVLAATILASSLAFIHASVVNVGLPVIGETFHAGAEDVQWVINAYLLPLSALLLLGGGAGDRFGRVRLQVAGILLFGMASVAPSLPWLLLARGIQGTGAPLLMPNSLAILAAPSPAKRMRALILRRVGLLETGVGGPVIVGRSAIGDAFRLENFLRRNGHPYQTLNSETDTDAKALVERFHVDPGQLPVVLCPQRRAEALASFVTGCVSDSLRLVDGLPFIFKRGHPCFDTGPTADAIVPSG
jgi:hypothetical protein